MRKFGFTQLPTGCIVGKALLVAVKKYTNQEEHHKDSHLHLASTVWGDYGFVLERVERLDKPIFCKGKLNFWDYDLVR